jgi:DnaK suppressor protein
MLTPMAEKSHLNAKQLAKLRDLLEQKRDQLAHRQRAHVDSAVVVEDQLIERGDQAASEAQIEESVPLAEQERRILEEIEHALDKMDDGTYGLSEVSGQPIPYERLLAVPWARASVEEIERPDR